MTIYFDANLAGSGFSRYNSVVNPQCINIVDDPILGASRKVMSFLVHLYDTALTGEPRAQCETPQQFNAGDDIWIGWATMFDNSWPAGPLPGTGWITLSEIYGPPFNGGSPLNVGQAGGLPGISSMLHPPNSPDWQVAYNIDPIPRNVWIDFALHEKLATDSSGFFELWMNTGSGWTSVYRNTSITTLTSANNGGPNYHKLALYWDHTMGYSQLKLWHTGQKIASTLAEVDPLSYSGGAVTTVPSAPAKPTVTAGNGQATVSFAAPANGGSSIIDYTVTSTPGGFTSTGAGSPRTVTGLTNGTAYTFKVTARNAIGSSPASVASNPATPTGGATTVSSAPLNVVAAGTGNSGEVLVTFSPPSSNGNTAIIDYTVTVVGVGAVSPGPETSVIVSRLTDGQPYTFTVTARNSVGSSAASAASNAAAPFASPTVVQINAGGPAFTDSLGKVWAADTGFVGGVVNTHPAGTTGTTEPGLYLDDRHGAAMSYVFSGVANGTYRVTVYMAELYWSAAGQRVASATANGVPIYSGLDVFAAAGGTYKAITRSVDIPVTTGTVTVAFTASVDQATVAAISLLSLVAAPDPPTNLIAIAGNASASVSFTPPTNNGGAPIIDYLVTSSPGGLTATTVNTTASITGLTNGQAYTFTVQSRNSVGLGVASPPSSAVIPSGSATVPGAPTNVTASPGNASATVSWSVPASNGSAAIIDYTVTSAPGGLTATATGTSATVTTLTNGTPYTFTVTARNAIGSGAVSGASNSVTPSTSVVAPGPPTGLLATAGNAQATVAFTSPASNGGSAVIDYTITSSPGGLTVVVPGP